MKTVSIAILAAAALFAASGCTANSRARNFGGNTTIRLPECHKLVNATWKEEDIWYLTRPFRDEEPAENFFFDESSSFGMMNGTVSFVESCPGHPSIYDKMK